MDLALSHLATIAVSGPRALLATTLCTLRDGRHQLQPLVEPQPSQT